MPKPTAIKTSHSHPLHIDSLQLSDIPAFKDMKGCIGMTFCPGQKYTGELSGEWRRNFSVDFEIIKRWGANVWLNTLQTAEMVNLKLDPILFEATVCSANIVYYHLPILDGSIPSSAEDKRWRERISPALRRHLQNGDKVLIHCRAGLGRTGMMTARLLADLGCPPQEAIIRVRTLRLWTIQNSLQEAWVASGHGPEPVRL